VARSIAIVRAAATETGRDPGAIACYAAVVVAPERSPRDTGLAVNARAAGYFHVSGLGDALVAANGWDPDALARYRAQPALVALGEVQADKALSRDELVEVSRALPEDWLPSSSAFGALDHCAERLHEYVDAGADGLVLHGTTAEHVGPLTVRFTELAP
jgi:hypothetical protein